MNIRRKIFLASVIMLFSVFFIIILLNKNDKKQELANFKKVLIKADTKSKNLDSINRDYLIDAIIEEAKAYLAKGETIQYDMRRLSAVKVNEVEKEQTINSRRNIWAKPEEANSDTPVYLDCSSFVNSIYKNVGIFDAAGSTIKAKTTTKALSDYAKANYDSEKPDTVAPLYKDITVSNIAEIQGILNQMKLPDDDDNSILKPGDLLVYRHYSNAKKPDDQGGHVMLYVGDGKFIHCTGDSYKSSSEYWEANGAIQVMSIDDLTDENGTRYLLEEKEIITGDPNYSAAGLSDESKTSETPEKITYLYNTSVSIIRYINDNNIGTILGNTDKISNEAFARMEMKGLVIEKEASTKNNREVAIGDNIENYIKIRNNGTEVLTDLLVTESINSDILENISNINYSGEYKSGNIKWNISKLFPNQEIVLKCKAKIKEDAANKELLTKAMVRKKDSSYYLETNELKFYVRSYVITKAQENIFYETALKYYEKAQKGYIEYVSSNSASQTTAVNLKNGQTSLGEIQSDSHIKVSMLGLYNMLYYNTFGIDLNEYFDTSKNVMDDITTDVTEFYSGKDINDIINNIIGKTYTVKDIALYVKGKKEGIGSKNLLSMLVPELYGGRKVISIQKIGEVFSSIDDTRARIILKDYFKAGDIVVYRYNSNGTEYGMAYIYIGNNTFMSIENNGIILKSGEAAEYFLEGLLSKVRFGIFRPSLNNDIAEQIKLVSENLFELDSTLDEDTKTTVENIKDNLNRIKNMLSPEQREALLLAAEDYYAYRAKFNYSSTGENYTVKTPEELSDGAIITTNSLISGIYREAFNISIPPSTTEMLNEKKYPGLIKNIGDVSATVNLDNLEVGDILIYEYGENSGAEKLYIGNGTFLYASSISNTMIKEDIDEVIRKISSATIPSYVDFFGEGANNYTDDINKKMIAIAKPSTYYDLGLSKVIRTRVTQTSTGLDETMQVVQKQYNNRFIAVGKKIQFCEDNSESEHRTNNPLTTKSLSNMGLMYGIYYNSFYIKDDDMPDTIEALFEKDGMKIKSLSWSTDNLKSLLDFDFEVGDIVAVKYNKDEMIDGIAAMCVGNGKFIICWDTAYKYDLFETNFDDSVDEVEYKLKSVDENKKLDIISIFNNLKTKDEIGIFRPKQVLDLSNSKVSIPAINLKNTEFYAKLNMIANRFFLSDKIKDAVGEKIDISLIPEKYAEENAITEAGLVSAIYMQALGLDIPFTFDKMKTKNEWKVGDGYQLEEITPSLLETGDIIISETGDIKFVGLYLGNNSVDKGRFISYSNNKVIVKNISEISEKFTSFTVIRPSKEYNNNLKNKYIKLNYETDIPSVRWDEEDKCFNLEQKITIELENTASCRLNNISLDLMVPQINNIVEKEIRYSTDTTFNLDTNESKEFIITIKYKEVPNKNLFELNMVPVIDTITSSMIKSCLEKNVSIDVLKGYSIEDEFIKNIQPNTTLNNLLKYISTNADKVSLYKDNKEVDDTTILATNMKIEFSFGNITSTYTIIVTGDVNGDGKADFKDMIGINKHRLSKKMLNGAFLIGGDVTGDGKLNFKDIVKINKFRLKKINEL